MKKKILFIIIASMLFGGVVSAATLWGTYKGNQIIRLTVDGVPVKVSDMPAISYNGRTMIPIYLLQQAGIQYEWDQKNQTVNIIGQNKVPDAPPEQLPKTTIKDIYKLAAAVGYVEGLDANGKTVCSGSGVMLDSGYFVTNHHVGYCGDSGRITVKIDNDTFTNGEKGWYFFSNESIDLYGVGISKAHDSEGRVIGKIPGTGFTINNTDLPEIGDKVYAIGSPYGLENTISEGVVSGIRTVGGMTYIQHTCDTEHGSSGGALMDENGYLIGITSAGIEGTNLDFAIPISYVKAEIDKLAP